MKNRNGDWLHLYDCTYCQMRKVYKKAIDKKYEREVCTVTGNTLPAPRSPGRCCEHFIQTGCGCPLCVTVDNQSDYTIDIPEGIC
ncbi:MAG: hypothetical protein ABSE06_01460 [Anaerolineaceae bacterium]